MAIYRRIPLLLLNSREKLIDIQLYIEIDDANDDSAYGPHTLEQTKII